MQQEKPLRWARVLADALTYSRLVAAAALLVWPWEPSTRSLAVLLRCKILLWSADAVDGALARRSRTPPSWIGRNDIWIDSLVTLGTGVSLARMGLVPAAFVVAWLAACAAAYAFRPVHTALLAFMFPLQATLVLLAVAYGLPEVWLLAAWLAVLACLAWRRLKWVIAVFIDGLPGALRGWVWSWLPSFLRLTREERAAYEAHAASGEDPGVDPITRAGVGGRAAARGSGPRAPSPQVR